MKPEVGASRRRTILLTSAPFDLTWLMNCSAASWTAFRARPFTSCVSSPIRTHGEDSGGVVGLTTQKPGVEHAESRCPRSGSLDDDVDVGHDVSSVGDHVERLPSCRVNTLQALSGRRAGNDVVSRWRFAFGSGVKRPITFVRRQGAGSTGGTRITESNTVFDIPFDAHGGSFGLLISMMRAAHSRWVLRSTAARA